MENWHELKEQVDSIDKDLKVLKEMVVEIRTAIRGNHLNPNGYGPMIDDHEKRINDLENKGRENKMAESIFKIAGGATVGAAVVKILESFLK
jgi:uncharacterized coiled-coil DUF342 family protein